MSRQAYYERGLHAPYAWSARLEINPRTSKDETLALLGEFVTEQADSSKPLSGMIVGEGTLLRSSVILGLDPSKTYGTPSLETCEQLVAGIEDTLSWQRQPDVQLHEMRMFMGLRPGYDPQAEAYEVPIVHRLTAAQNIGRYSVLAGDVFSLRYIEEDSAVRSYSEPGVAIYTPPELSDEWLQIAYALDQQRVVAETFGVDTQVYQRAY